MFTRRLQAIVWVAVALCCAPFFIAATLNHDRGVTVESMAEESRDFYGGPAEEAEFYLPPMTNMEYKITTYAGQTTSFPFDVSEGSARIVRYAWDYDSDGSLDWSSDIKGNSPVFTFPVPRDYVATFYAFQPNGEYIMAVIPVKVLAGSGEQQFESNEFKPTWWGMAEKRRRAATATATDSGKTYFLLVAAGYGSIFTEVDSIRQRLIDSIGTSDDDIVFCAPPDMADSSFFDFSCLDSGIDSAFNYLISAMTMNDDLHVVLNGHGSGRWDSTCVEFGDNIGDSNKTWSYDAVPFLMYAGSAFSNLDHPGDGDITESESEFCWTYFADYGCGLKKSHGLSEWAAYNHAYAGWYDRRMLVVTFDSMTFVNSAKTSDTDFFVEEIRQYLVVDTNHNGQLDEYEDQDWDSDSDGNPPLLATATGFVFDDDDWGAHGLTMDYNHTACTTGFQAMRLFDSGFDGHVDVCWGVSGLEFNNPGVNGTDTDNDGIIVGIDVTQDGDMNDSVGVNERLHCFADDVWAEYFDSLSYKHVSFITTTCFGGGIINDLSRDSVVVLSTTTEGTYGYVGPLHWWSKWLTGQQWAGANADRDSNGYVSIAEAWNRYQSDNSHSPAMIDDNGDRFGQHDTLPYGGDGSLAATLSWGRLPDPTPAPVLVSPLNYDTLFTNEMPVLVWSDTGNCDSFTVTITSPVAGSSTVSGLTDTTYTTVWVQDLKFIPTQPYDIGRYSWTVKAYRGLTYSTSAVRRFNFLLDDCCNHDGLRGDVDMDSNITMADLTLLYDFIWGSHTPLNCIVEGDLQYTAAPYANRLPDSTDFARLVDYLFINYTPPDSCDQ